MALELGCRPASGARSVRRSSSFNPVTWFDSVIWGQVDSFGVVFLLLGVRELWRDRPERAAVLAVIAALIKPQLAILVPIVAAVDDPAGALARADAAYGAEAGDSRRRGPPRPVPRLGAPDRGPIRILTTGLAGLVTTIAAVARRSGCPCSRSARTACAPGSLEQIFSTAAGYPYLSVNAYNPWALAELNGNGHRRERRLDLRRRHRQPGPGRRRLRRGVPGVRRDPRRRARGGPARVAFAVVCGVVASGPTG